MITSPTILWGIDFPMGKYFVSKKVDRKLYFMEFLVDGVVDIYYLRDIDAGDKYYIQSEGEVELKEGNLTTNRRNTLMVSFITLNRPGM